MIRYSKTLAWFLVACLWSFWKSYGDVPSEAITIQQAVSTALKQNPALNNFREKVTEANSNVGFATSQIFPNITASGTMDYQKDPANQNNLFGGNPYSNYNVSVKLTQPLFEGGAILGGLGVAKKQVQINSYAAQQNERDLTLAVITDFYGTLYNQRLLDTLRRTETAVNESVKTAHRFYKNGRAQLTDLLSLKTTLALLQPQITLADAAITTNASHLNYDLGQENRKSFSITSDFLTPAPEEILAKVAKPKRRPEYESILAQIDQLSYQRMITLAPNYPNLSAFATVGRSAYVKSDLISEVSDQWTLGLQLSIPLFSGLSSFQQRSVLASQEAELHLQGVDLNHQENYNEFNAEKLFNSAVSVLDSTKVAFELADQALKESQKNYRLQTIDMIVLVQIEQNYLAASSAYDNAKYQYIIAAGNLFVAKGIPMAEWVGMLK